MTKYTQQAKLLYTSEDKNWILVKSAWSFEEDAHCAKAIHLNCPKLEPELIELAVFRDASWFMDEDPECWHCHLPVPDDIRSLFVLYEFGENNLDRYDRE